MVIMDRKVGSEEPPEELHSWSCQEFKQSGDFERFTFSDQKYSLLSSSVQRELQKSGKVKNNKTHF